MSSSLVNSLAKVYDPKPLHGQKLGGRKPSLNGLDKYQASSSSSSSPTPSSHDVALHCVESRMDSLSSQMERLLNMQQTVLTRLDGLSQDLRDMGQDLASMREGVSGERRRSGVEVACKGLHRAVERTSEQLESQGRRLEGVEKLVEGTQQVITFIGEAVKSSRLVELLFKQPGNKSCKKAKDDKDKAKVSLKASKTQKKRKPVDTSDPCAASEPVLHEQVEKFNRQNCEHSHENTEAESHQANDTGSADRRHHQLARRIGDGAHTSASQSGEREEEKEEDILKDSQPEEEEEEEEKGEDVIAEAAGKGEDDGTRRHEAESEEKAPPLLESPEEVSDVATCSKRHVTEEDVAKDDLKKSKVESAGGEAVAVLEAEAVTVAEADSELHVLTSDKSQTEAEEYRTDGKTVVTEFMIDSSPPPLAPFDHRIVTPKPHQIATYYTINRDEVLGGGRFGQVHKCTENSSGLKLAAKIIKARSQKEKEVVRNEIQVMNQLNHANLIQLYAAFESRHDVILVMEYVEGGELFDRIIDENYNLTELDTVLFIRQICEGLQYMHHMYILHLDLKPENILCVSRVTNKIKIIDFGLARRYKPREKLKVNFGTPEFLAPEVINYEFVSFPTDMWSLGVITYMLLSGLSPFLGDDDNETLNNILACQWNFEEEEFTDISEEAKDFISRLLVKSKSWRMSAAESLRHSWLSDQSLHYRLNQKFHCDALSMPSDNVGAQHRTNAAVAV